jgi:hypothetical protein
MASFPTAAMNGLYKAGAAGAFRTKTTNYRGLKKSDMKQLVSILSGVPYPTTLEADNVHSKAVVRAIQKLPYHLCSSALSHVFSTQDETGKVKPKSLCSTHKGLNSMLVYSIWGWIKHELDDAIGPFLLPVLMSAELTKAQEWAARQLEPVLRMYRAEFTLEGATPCGFQSIPAHRWIFERNECPACMLARMGSDAVVLAALVSGIVGRSSSRHVGRTDSVKSKRIAMLKYWMLLHEQGRERFEEAWELGKVLRRVHKALKKRERAKREDSAYAEVHAEHDLTYRRSNSTSYGTSQGRLRRESASTIIPLDVSQSYLPSSSHSRIASRSPSAPSPKQDSVISIDISDPFIPPPRTRPNHRNPPPASSVYSRNTADARLMHARTYCPGNHPQPTLHSISHSSVLNANSTTHHTSSIYSQTGHYSIASSYDSNASDISFNRLPSYASSEFNGASLRPTPLRLDNTSREAAREKQLIPRGNRSEVVSMYVEAGRQSCNWDMYEDVSPPDSPTVGGGWSDGDGEDECDVGSPETPRDEKCRLTRLTEWDKLY